MQTANGFSGNLDDYMQFVDKRMKTKLRNNDIIYTIDKI